VPLRGRMLDIHQLGPAIRQYKGGDFALCVLDALYRFEPANGDENSNAGKTGFYNQLDNYAEHLDCAIVGVHHASKGNQSEKAVTDVGAGAGAQSRAADCHMILRPHKEEGAIVLEAVVRSFPPVEAAVMQWQFPLWRPALDLDPSDLLEQNRKPAKKPEAEARKLSQFVDEIVPLGTRATLQEIKAKAKDRYGVRGTDELLTKAEATGLLHVVPGRGNKPKKFSQSPFEEAE
jgi:hypothetical protein